MAIPILDALSDEEFNAKEANIRKSISADPSAFGLTPEEARELDDSGTAWGADYGSHLGAQSVARAARVKKDETRKNHSKKLKTVLKKVDGSTSVPADKKAELGCLPKASGASVGKPKTRPIGTIDTSKRLQHLIQFTDETTPRKIAKPTGYNYIEIFLFVGDAAPADDSGYALVATDSNSPYLMQFKSSDLGKTAFYKFRWVSTSGIAGDLSETFSAVVR